MKERTSQELCCASDLARGVIEAATVGAVLCVVEGPRNSKSNGYIGSCKKLWISPRTRVLCLCLKLN